MYGIRELHGFRSASWRVGHEVGRVAAQVDNVATLPSYFGQAENLSITPTAQLNSSIQLAEGRPSDR